MFAVPPAAFGLAARPKSALAMGSSALVPLSASVMAPAAASASPTQIARGPEIVTDRHGNHQYLKGKFLGKGGFAKCYLLTDMETNKKYAGKIVAKATLSKHRAKEKLTSEIKIHKNMKHTNIVGFARFFEDSDNVYILLELCDNQSLMDLHKRRRVLSEPEVRYYVKQIVEGTRHMHSEHVIHRDLKLGNLFLNADMRVKIGDFGLATVVTFDGERKKTLCGTPNYIAPEILDRTGGHSYEVDTWSIGCILFTLLFGKPPFETSNIESTYKKIQCNDYAIPSTPVVSDNAKELIRQCLHPAPASRPSMEEMLRHPFFTAHFVPDSLPLSALTIPPKFAAASPASPATVVSPSGGGLPMYLASAATLKSGAPRRPLGVLNTESPGSAPSSTAKPTPTPFASLGAPYPFVASRLPGAPAVFASGHTSSPAAPASVADGGRQPSRTVSSLDEIGLCLKSVATQNALAPAHIAPIPLRACDAKSGNGVWITKWVDYSNKYGLGFQISDGTVGVLFNDATKMMLAVDNTTVEFVDRDGTQQCQLESFPAALTKKITLLKYFKGYMNDHLLTGGDQAQAIGATAVSQLPFVRKWIRSKQAIVFRLNNNVIQVNFFDHSKLILNTPTGLVTYIDTHKASHTYNLVDIAASSHASVAELANRISYTSEVVSGLGSSTPSGSKC